MEGYKLVPVELLERFSDAIEQVGYQDKFIDYNFVHNVKGELRSLLAAAPVPPQADALLVAWQRKSKNEDGRWFALPDSDVEEAIRLGYEVRKLYTHPDTPEALNGEKP